MSNPSLIKRFPINTAGRDFAVGDIHGHFTRLKRALDAVGFDPAVDRLFSIGDLVDRGPESEESFDWIRKPWFHSVQGNHEDMTIRAGRSDDRDARDHHYINGGGWLYGLSAVEQRCYAEILAELPLAIEVETPGGLVGLVHADVPRSSWSQFTADLAAGGLEAEHIAAMCQWSRKRISAGDASGVQDVSAVVCGHTPLRQPVVLGNVYHIDTGGWFPDGSGYFTLLDLHTLEAAKPERY